MENKISVIIPVYNVKDYLRECVDSVINQNYKNLEIILVDDGSTDGSEKICDEYKKNDDRIIVIHKENGGLASARNKGMEVASGNYLFFIDSDDFIELSTIDELYKNSNSGTKDLVMCNYYWYDEHNKKEISIVPFYNENNPKCIVTAMPTATCKLIKKKLFTENNLKFLEGKYYEDNAIMPYVLSLVNDYSYIQKPFYYYRQRSGSILNKNKYDKKWEDIFDVLEYLSKKFTNDNFNEELEYLYIEYLLHAASLKFYKYEEGKNNIKKIKKVIHKNFPNWRKNKYYKQQNIKYKIVCNLFYYNQVGLIKLILR